MLNKIRIVLVGTTHPGNIGAAARAMKTMGLTRLYLVSPRSFPHEEASSRASGAENLLLNACVTDSLTDAIHDCSLVIGTSARNRSLAWKIIEPSECGQITLNEARQGQEIALVFGRERIGLTNEELALCHYHVTIPTVPDFSSLNLAAAVQIIVYEIYNIYSRAAQQALSAEIKLDYASSEQIEHFFQHLEQIMIQTEFLDPNEPKKLMLRLRRLFARTRLEHQEVNILRGILTAMEKKIGKLSS